MYKMMKNNSTQQNIRLNLNRSLRIAGAEQVEVKAGGGGASGKPNRKK